MTAAPRTVLVLAGGPDAEHEVSLQSATTVAGALAQATAGGRPLRVLRLDLPRTTGESELARMARTIADEGVEAIFPVLHGRWGEGGGLQTALELIGIPYVGAGPRAAALAMDKERMKRRMSAAGCPTPASAVIGPDDPLALAPPLVLKPVDDGSSVDLAICRDDAEVAAARRHLHPRRGRLLAERYVAGREITVGLLDGAPLPIIEIVPAAGTYDYAAKYEREDTGYRLDPDLPAGVAAESIRIAEEAWERSGARDLARVDLIVDDAGPWFLEINTMPGFTGHSLLPMAAASAGIELPELCGRLIERALSRRRSCAAPGTFKPATPSRRS